MMHSKRRWAVGSAPSAEELARMLTERTWCLCTGFYVDGHPEILFLNDSISEDGAGEWAVLRGGLAAKEHVQIESITFSWTSFEGALRLVNEALEGKMDHSDFARPVQPKLESIEQHARCHLCA